MGVKDRACVFVDVRRRRARMVFSALQPFIHVHIRAPYPVFAAAQLHEGVPRGQALHLYVYVCMCMCIRVWMCFDRKAVHERHESGIHLSTRPFLHLRRLEREETANCCIQSQSGRWNHRNTHHEAGALLVGPAPRQRTAVPFWDHDVRGVRPEAREPEDLFGLIDRSINRYMGDKCVCDCAGPNHSVHR